MHTVLHGNHYERPAPRTERAGLPTRIPKGQRLHGAQRRARAHSSSRCPTPGAPSKFSQGSAPTARLLPLLG